MYLDMLITSASSGYIREVVFFGKNISLVLIRHAWIVSVRHGALSKNVITFFLSNFVIFSHGLEEPLAEFRHSNRLKEKLLDHFGEKIQFTKVGNKNVLNFSDLSPLTYTEATLKGNGLREEDIAKAFANLIRRKLSEKKDYEKTCRFKPSIPSEFLISLHERNPFSYLFYAISWSINPIHWKHSMVAESWERLITRKNTPTTTSKCASNY